MRIRRIFLLPLLFLIFQAGLAAQDAWDKVAEGIARMESGDLEAAQSAFAEADVALPENEIIAFDQGCAAAGLGDLEKAVGHFQDASLSRDEGVAAAARYNLGAVAAERAKALFGEEPENAPPETRQEGLEHLHRAVRHYRDCIAIDPDHDEARYNLELIRLWIKQMDAVWKEKDKQKAREEMDLLRFLAMIEARQEELRRAARSLDPEPDSPRRRQGLGELKSEQRALAEEIDPLKAKIESSLAGPAAGAPPASAAPQPQMSDEEKAQVLGVLDGWAEEARGSMEEAADRIPEETGEAVLSQREALDHLNRIFGAVASFPAVLDRALETQQGLVEVTSVWVETPDKTEAFGPNDSDEQNWRQGRVADWSGTMAYKAKAELEAQEGREQAPGADPNAPNPGPADSAGAMKEALEKAMELCPRIDEAAREAAEHLKASAPAQALPLEEEALKLLKEIQEKLPKQENQNPDQGDQEQPDSGEQEQQQPPRQESEQPQKQERISPEEAESLLQKVKEREREHREQKDRLQRALAPPGKTEKDW